MADALGMAAQASRQCGSLRLVLDRQLATYSRGAALAGAPALRTTTSRAKPRSLPQGHGAVRSEQRRAKWEGILQTASKVMADVAASWQGCSAARAEAL
jgi:hypothetical protein